MSLFDKFNNFEMKADDSISEEDKKNLRRFQEIYEGTLLYYSRVYALYKEETNKYTKRDNDYFYSGVQASSLNIFDTVKKLQLSYRSHIYSYFRGKYHVDLDDRETSEDEKYKSMRLYREPDEEEIKELYKKRTYDTILKDIIGQLGGMSFSDVESQQIKNKMKKACLWGDKWRIEVKNATLKYNGWTSVSSNWRSGYRVQKNDFLEHLPDALGMFIENSSKSTFVNCLRGYDIDLTEEEMKNGIKFSSGFKISVIKFYKNGRIDLKFESPEYARDFARTWCGYTLI